MRKSVSCITAAAYQCRRRAGALLGARQFWCKPPALAFGQHSEAAFNVVRKEKLCISPAGSMPCLGYLHFRQLSTSAEPEDDSKLDLSSAWLAELRSSWRQSKSLLNFFVYLETIDSRNASIETLEEASTTLLNRVADAVIVCNGLGPGKETVSKCLVEAYHSLHDGQEVSEHIRRHGLEGRVQRLHRDGLLLPLVSPTVVQSLQGTNGQAAINSVKDTILRIQKERAELQPLMLPVVEADEDKQKEQEQADKQAQEDKTGLRYDYAKGNYAHASRAFVAGV